MPRTSSVHAVTTIGMDMGKNTLHMIGLDSRGAVLRQRRQPLRSFGHSPRAQPPRLPVIGFPAARRGRICDHLRAFRPLCRRATGENVTNLATVPSCQI